MKIVILVAVVALSSCAAPQSLMPEAIRSDVARFDPQDLIEPAYRSALRGSVDL